MLIHTIRRRPAIICHEREHAPTSSCRRWRAAMAALIAKHKHLMSKWTRRGGGNAHKQTRFFSPQRSCYGTHLWALLSLERVLIFCRGWTYCRIPSHDVGGSAGANAMPARDALLLAMHCIGFQNGRRHADENVWDHELATSDPLKTLEPPLYVGSKQTRTKFSHKWRSNECQQEFAQVYRTGTSTSRSTYVLFYL